MRPEVLAALVLGTATGCIQRYAAPAEAVPVEDPYAAVATWHGVTLDPGTGASPPTAALRVVGAPTWYADAVLIDGAGTADGEAAVAEFIRRRPDPVVFLTGGDACIPDAWGRTEVYRAVLQDDAVAVVPLTARCAAIEPEPEPE